MKVVRKAHREKLRENRVGVGERRCNRTCKHRFQFIFPVNQSYDWLIVTVHFNTYLSQSFGFARTEYNKPVEHVKPSCTAPFDVLTFDILTRETVFQKVGGYLRYLKKCFQVLPFSIPAVFRPFAIWLLARLFRLSALIESLAQATSATKWRNIMISSLLGYFFS